MENIRLIMLVMVVHPPLPEAWYDRSTTVRSLNEAARKAAAAENVASLAGDPLTTRHLEQNVRCLFETLFDCSNALLCINASVKRKTYLYHLGFKLCGPGSYSHPDVKEVTG